MLVKPMRNSNVKLHYRDIGFAIYLRAHDNQASPQALLIVHDPKTHSSPGGWQVWGLSQIKIITYKITPAGGARIVPDVHENCPDHWA